MDEVFKMYAMSDGNPDAEPAELDPITIEDFERTKRSKPPACLPPRTTTRE